MSTGPTFVASQVILSVDLKRGVMSCCLSTSDLIGVFGHRAAAKSGSDLSQASIFEGLEGIPGVRVCVGAVGREA